MITRTPSSTVGLLVRSKTFVVACLLSSAAMIAEPQVAHARGGMNGFMAGAILGGAMRGLTPRGGYRTPRAYGTRRGTSSSRHGRSRNKPDKEIEAKDAGGEKVFGNTQVPAAAAAGATGAAATGAAATGAAATGAAAASTSGSGTSAAAAGSSGSSGNSEAGSSGRSSRSGRSGGLQTIKDGLD